jgi:hypothetical protein
MPRDGEGEPRLVLTGGVLALDLSSAVGWAYGHQPQELAHGTWQLPMVGGEGARGAAFAERLAELLEEVEPAHLVLEAPLPPLAQTNMRSARQQYGLTWQAHTEAWHARCAVSEINAQAVRDELLGCRYSKDVVKREVLRYCHRRGIKVATHHAADAALVWLWHYGRLNGGSLSPPKGGREGVP